MSRSCSTLISLLAVLTAAKGFAQTTEDFSVPRLMLAEQPSQSPPPSQSPQSPQTPPSQIPSPAIDNPAPTEPPIRLDRPAEETSVTSLSEFWGYRYATSALEWIPGGGDHFGMFSIVWDHYEKPGVKNGLGVGLGFHFLGGPEQTDMPPRVYDFSLAYQIRQRLGPLAFDVATSVLAASDFEGSARKGILFPSHAVGFLNLRPEIDLVFGIDYLDRGDIKLLPVAGLIWVPTPELRFELVFPRPRAYFQLTDHNRLYLAGELGGGSWAIERVSLANDLATYRDLRVCIGVEYLEKGGQRSAFEIGYLFDRRLEFSSGVGDTHLLDAAVLRLVTTY
jgi:hypothetical protein